MAEHLFLRLGEATDEASVVVLDAEGRLVRGPEILALSAVAGLAAGMQVTALLPAAELVSIVANLPQASPARLRQMLPFTLEDEFAADIDALHFAAGERNAADRLAVSVMARERLDFWLGVLRATGIEPRRVCSEIDGVPDTPGVVTVFLEGRRTLGRRAGGAPFSFETLPLGEIWQLLAGEREDATDLREVVLFGDPATLAERAREIDAWRGDVDHLNVQELDAGVLPRLAATLVHRPGPNLLQGAYATRSDLGALLRPWRSAAAMLVAFLAFAVIGKGAELIKLSRDDSGLTTEVTQVCERNFSSSQLSRCRAEMQRRLAENNQAAVSGGGGFLQTLAAVAAAGGDAVAIEGINYRSSVLALEVVVPSISYLDTLGQRLGEAGPFRLEVQSTVPEGNRTLARLQIVAVTE